MPRALVVLVLALAAVPRAAWPQGEHRHGSKQPVGPEFRVNTFTTGNQGAPSATFHPNGFVAVWGSDGQDGSGMGVIGKVGFGGGGPEFRVNTYTTGDQHDPNVASNWNGSGDFVVVWTSPQDGSGDGIFAQRFASNGAPLGGEFRVNTYTTGTQYQAAVAADFSGDFVVVWSSVGQEGAGAEVFGQRFSSSGLPLGSEFQVNTYTTGRQSYPAVAKEFTSNGCFVVAWSSDGEDESGSGVFGRVYYFGNEPLEVFRFNEHTTGNQTRASVGALPEFDLVVLWDSEGQDGSGTAVYGRVDNHFIPVELMQFGVE